MCGRRTQVALEGSSLIFRGSVDLPNQASPASEGSNSMPSLREAKSGTLFPCKLRPLRDLTRYSEAAREIGNKRSETNRLRTRRERLAPTAPRLRGRRRD